MANLGGIFSGAFNAAQKTKMEKETLKENQAAARKKAFLDPVVSYKTQLGVQLENSLASILADQTAKNVGGLERANTQVKTIKQFMETTLPQFQSYAAAGVKNGYLSEPEAAALLAEVEATFTQPLKTWTDEMAKFQDERNKIAAQTSPEAIQGASGKAAAVTKAEEANKFRAPNPQNFIGPGGEKVFVDLNSPNAAQEVADLKAKGYTEFGQSVQASDVSGLSTKVTGDLEGKVVAGRDRVSRLQKIRSTFNESYLQLPAKAREALLSTWESLGGDLSKNQKEFLTEMSTFRQDAIAEVNHGIKEMTGAQMSEPEAKRLSKQFANPEKDSPTQFIAKVDNALATMIAATARYEYMLKHGIDTNPGDDGEYSLPIDKFKDIVNSRVDSLIVEYTARGMSASEAKKQAMSAAKTEFGL